jgi:GntR family transcriptional regulator
MYVAAGAADRLRSAERSRFLDEEWPELKARMRRLGLDAAQLLADA